MSTSRRRFTGLSGYKKLLDSGIEAIAIEDIPYFYPEQAQAAVNAGCHVYMAKPVATDVPGCLAIEAAAKQATQKKLCFHVDYQMPTDPVNIEIAQRIWDGGLGKILSISTWGSGGGRRWQWTPRGKRRSKTSSKGCGGFATSPWAGDQIGNFDIHSIDAAMWITRQVPIAASGQARICRPNPRRRSPRPLCADLRVPQRHGLGAPKLRHSGRRHRAGPLLRHPRRIGQRPDQLLGQVVHPWRTEAHGRQRGGQPV